MPTSATPRSIGTSMPTSGTPRSIGTSLPVSITPRSIGTSLPVSIAPWSIGTSLPASEPESTTALPRSITGPMSEHTIAAQGQSARPV
nr:hypothetical protein [Deltaproteobacteria bacterium]